jgi:peptide/nickel transport system ATP-binding protein
VLSVRDLRIKIGQQQVVDGLSFDVMPGERVCLLGASGSGKSFTANAVLGLLPPSAQVQGSIRIQGQEAIATPATQRPKNARVSMVFQDSLSALNPLVSIGEL